MDTTTHKHVMDTICSKAHQATLYYESSKLNKYIERANRERGFENIFRDMNESFRLRHVVYSVPSIELDIITPVT